LVDLEPKKRRRRFPSFFACQDSRLHMKRRGTHDMRRKEAGICLNFHIFTDLRIRLLNFYHFYTTLKLFSFT
jgi:hypothetical protein